MCAYSATAQPAKYNSATIQHIVEGPNRHLYGTCGQLVRDGDMRVVCTQR